MHQQQTLDNFQYMYVTECVKMCNYEYIFAFQPEMQNLLTQPPQTPCQLSGALDKDMDT